MEIALLPKGINKIIEEYCNYPKKYIEGLHYRINLIYRNMDSYEYDLSYGLHSIGGINLDKYFRPNISFQNYYGNEIKKSLIERQNKRNLEYGIKDNPYHNRCHYPY